MMLMLDIAQDFPDKDNLLTVLSKFDEVFGPLTVEGMRIPPMEIRIQEGGRLKAQPCRFVSPKLMSALKAELDNYLEKE